MRYAVIMAGGSGTRLWPMSRRNTPKQLIPFLDGRSLLQMAWERLIGLIEPDGICVCAAEAHREPIMVALPELRSHRFIGEPMGRDTLNAIGLSAVVLYREDPDAVFAAVTSDHIIGPPEAFREYLDRGFAAVEDDPCAVATFGIRPTAASTGFGYLEIGEPVGGGLRTVVRFHEKPELPRAQEFFEAGPDRFLWNSGMFVWRASTLLDCIRRYEPEVHSGLLRIADAWESPSRDAVLRETYPTLRKISVDFAVMQPAAQDPAVRVVAVPMRLEWMDVGNWSSFAQTCPADEAGNRLHAGRAILQGCRETLVASTDPGHLIAAIGCEGMVIVHTPDATLICPADRVEDVKTIAGKVQERFGHEAV